MVLSCAVAYLTFAIPALIMIWAALIAAKHSDGEVDEEDFENNELLSIEFIDLNLKKRHS